MHFTVLATYLEQIEKTASSNEIISIVAEVLRKFSHEEIPYALYLMLGTLGPAYASVEFGLSDKLVARAIAHALDREPSEIDLAYKQAGDLGTVYFELANATSKQLSIQEVYRALDEIARTSGAGSVDAKITALSRLLHSLDQLEGKYVIRIILERLRTGLADAKVLDALSVIEAGDKSLRATIEGAYNVFPDIGKIAQLVLKDGVKGLAHVTATPGIPIRPAQSERLPTPERIVEKLGTFAVEPKMDGFRVQVHVFGKGDSRQVRLFSRNLNETTHMFPDIVEAAKTLPVTDGIFDSEALAFNPDTTEYLPFQDTVKRRRKHGVEEMSERVPLRVFLFDVLYMNGKALLDTPAADRFAQLAAVDYSTQSVIEVTRHDVVDSVEQLRALFDLYVSEGLEGVMCKKLDAEYQAGSRNFNWVKYKRATDQALNDTVDVVVLGYYVGQGQRNRFGIGAFLVGVHDEASGTFQSLAKIGTGLTDEQWIDMKQRLDAFEAPDKPTTYDVHANLSPDVWTLPKVVVEVAADEITRSPIHTAAKGESTLNGSGLALRFPRLVRVRDDKNPFDTTTSAELVSML